MWLTSCLSTSIGSIIFCLMNKKKSFPPLSNFPQTRLGLVKCSGRYRLFCLRKYIIFIIASLYFSEPYWDVISFSPNICHYLGVYWRMHICLSSVSSIKLTCKAKCNFCCLCRNLCRHSWEEAISFQEIMLFMKKP